MAHEYCLNITSKPTPDPFITQAHGKFYLTFTAGDRVPMWEADDIADFWDDKAKIGPVWRPPPNTPHSEALWAPELHALNGRWYIYYAAQSSLGNKSHRMYVLRGPPSHANPHAGPWEFAGPIRGMEQRQWAIDGTVFEVEGKLYFVYSGWPLPPERNWDDSREDIQQLFIIRLQDPETAASEPVLICRPDRDWERTGPVGICEGPQWLQSPDKSSWRGLVYSCGASWTSEYKMATLQLVGKDPLNAASWRKSENPLLTNAARGEGPFAPGHGSFLQIGNETFGVFHATDRQTDGHQGRKCRMQRVRWTDAGPHMGSWVGRATRDVGTFWGKNRSQTTPVDLASLAKESLRRALHHVSHQ